LHDYVKMIGSISEEDKSSLLIQHDYLCFLSRWGGPPRPIREALSVGTAVIISWETNMGELVKNEGAGEVVSLDSSELARMIVNIARNKNVISKHKVGVNRLADLLNWGNVSKTYVKSYNTILQSSNVSCYRGDHIGNSTD